MAARAVWELGGLPILALGAPLEVEWAEQVRARVPVETPVRSWVDFGAILPYTAAAIHHGGAGTTHALITHAIPQIVVPHAADQMRQAQGVARTRVGVSILPKNISTPVLVQVLAQLLPDRAPARAYAHSLRAEFAALGGTRAAAERLEALVG
jgi:UDP:flavonoid glycosyltransferase YjiC (YdhE family)